MDSEKHELFQYICEHSMLEEPFLTALDRETNTSCIHPRMLSGHIQGKILYMICKMINAKNILEIGTYTGYSAIAMGLALPELGVLHTIELNDELEEIASKYIAEANLSEKIVCHFGDALQIIPALDLKFDLVFIDADKREYCQYYDLVFDLVKPGGFILADNILWDGKVVDKHAQNDAQTIGIVEFNKRVANDNRVEIVIFPFRDGMSIIRKKLELE